jgi:hypothetical protein
VILSHFDCNDTLNFASDLLHDFSIVLDALALNWRTAMTPQNGWRFVVCFRSPSPFTAHFQVITTGGMEKRTVRYPRELRSDRQVRWLVLCSGGESLRIAERSSAYRVHPPRIRVNCIESGEGHRGRLVTMNEPARRDESIRRNNSVTVSESDRVRQSPKSKNGGFEAWAQSTLSQRELIRFW